MHRNVYTFNTVHQKVKSVVNVTTTTHLPREGGGKWGQAGNALEIPPANVWATAAARGVWWWWAGRKEVKVGVVGWGRYSRAWGIRSRYGVKV